MKCQLLLTIGVILLYSCQNKEIRFIELKQYKGSNSFYAREYERNIKSLYENYLMNNAPARQDKAALRALFLNFAKKRADSIRKSDIDIYRIAFYRKTANTAYFIDHKEDPGGFSSEELSKYCATEGMGELTLKRCKNDGKKWKLSIAYSCNSDGYFDQDVEVLSDECQGE